MLNRRRNTAEKFWAKVDRSGECWIWHGGHNFFGYGVLTYCGRRNVKAHRLSWELTNGPFPRTLWVLHRCDNPPCVNPAHLFLGTARDNVTDMLTKGRALPPSGETHPHHKLTVDQVRTIRRRRAAGEKRRAIALDYGVALATVSKISLGQRWKDVN